MRRFALALAAFVLANGALVLFNQRRVSEMKGRVETLEAERITLQREIAAQRLDLQSVSNDLCATELSKLQAERELRDLRRSSEFNPPSRAVDTRVLHWSKEAGILILGQGSANGCAPGMKFTIYRGDKFVASALIDDVGQKFSFAKIHLQRLEPAIGDDASNHILMSSNGK